MFFFMWVMYEKDGPQHKGPMEANIENDLSAKD